MSQNDTDVIDNLLFCATLIKGLEISMNAQRILSLIAATLLTTPVWAETTAAGLSTTDDYVNATSDRAAESKSGERFFGDRLKINGTYRYDPPHRNSFPFSGRFIILYRYCLMFL